MTRKGLQFTLIGAGAAVALAASALAAETRQGMGGEIGIYKGGEARNAGLTLRSWGSGEAKESEDYVYSGNKSIRIVTHGRYQGVRLVLDNPIDLNAAETDPAAYLQFLVVLPDKVSSSRINAYGPEGGYTGPPGMRGGGRRGPGGSGGSLGEGGYGSGGSARLVKAKPISSLRVVLVTDDNKRVETTLDVDSAHVEREEWSSLAVPVSAIAALKQTDGKIKEVQIFGDSPGMLYLGEARVVRDETPIRVDPLDERTIAKNDSLTFTASADAGPTPLKYEWKIQGIPKPEEQTEVTRNYVVIAEGRVFKHQFRKNGDYLVTLTVSDKYGLKKPASTSVNIRVTL